MAQSITPHTVKAFPATTPELGARLRLSIRITADSESKLGMVISYSYPLFFMSLLPPQAIGLRPEAFVLSATRLIPRNHQFRVPLLSFARRVAVYFRRTSAKSWLYIVIIRIYTRVGDNRVVHQPPAFANSFIALSHLIFDVIRKRDEAPGKAGSFQAA